MSHVVLLVALLLALSTSHRAEAQAIAPETLETLPAFIDATVPSLMEQNHVVGTALAIVYNGRTILLRGFGR